MATTQLSLTATPGMRYSFSAKTEAVVEEAEGVGVGVFLTLLRGETMIFGRDSGERTMEWKEKGCEL